MMNDAGNPADSPEGFELARVRDRAALLVATLLEQREVVLFDRAGANNCPRLIAVDPSSSSRGPGFRRAANCSGISRWTPTGDVVAGD
jgi:hypothetical protein